MGTAGAAGRIGTYRRGLGRRLAALSLGLLLAGIPALAEDWPNWRGPHHDGISRETGLLKSWPAAGPKGLWKMDLPGGYSSIAVAGGRVYTHAKENKEEIVLCVDAATGNKVWEFRYPADYDAHHSMDQRFKSGPRATPAVDGDRVYTIGTTGLLHCLDAKSGKQVWRVDLLQMAGRKCPEFGYCNSPLVAGDLLYVHPGGSSGNSIAALSKTDGKVVWKALSDPIGYGTPVLIKTPQGEQLIYYTGAGVVAVTPREGKELWRYPWKTDFDLNVATPVYSDGHLFISAAYGHGCALLKLKDGAAPEEVYKNLTMQAHFSTPVLFEGHVYGFSNDRLRCVELATGKVKWDARGMGRGSLLIADRQLIILSEQGDLVLADVSPAAFTEKARWKALEGTCWIVPVLSGGKLFLRNEKQMLAVDLRQ